MFVTAVVVRLRQGVQDRYAMDNDLTLKAAALKLGFVTEAEFDRIVDPKKMVKPYVAAAPANADAA
jgi:fumarate hydratase class II